MNRGIRFIFAGLAIFGLLIVGILLIASGGSDRPKPESRASKPLPDYASTNATVTATTEGAVNARELHREIRVAVSRNSRTLEVLRGYQGEVIKDKTYSNDEAAFSEFLYALSYANFTRERGTDLKSESGACALGNRYVFELELNGRNISRLWTSTCSGIGRGSFDGKTFNVLTLFEKQIPAYDDLTQRIRLQ